MPDDALQVAQRKSLIKLGLALAPTVHVKAVAQAVAAAHETAEGSLAQARHVTSATVVGASDYGESAQEVSLQRKWLLRVAAAEYSSSSVLEDLQAAKTVVTNMAMKAIFKNKATPSQELRQLAERW